jgi:hypothetical protein
MDSLINAAARALAAGDPIGALQRVALRDDAPAPPALALRGIAMAQLGDLARAKALLRRATRAFGPRETLARARSLLAEAEVALASRELGWPARALEAARATLEAHGDRLNAAHARYLQDASPRPSVRWPSSIPRPCHPRRGPSTSWWPRGSRSGGCGRGRRARRWLAPKRPRARRASPP